MISINIKDFICEAIERKKVQTVAMYDEKIEKIRSEDNIANVYYLLAETFHNTMEQGEIAIKLLKENLTNDFFKEAEAKNCANYIVFSNDEFDILFSKTLVRVIEIKSKKIKRPYGLYRPLSNDIIKLADAIEVFLKERTFQNFKKVVECNYKEYDDSPVGLLFKYVDTYKKCDEKLLKNIREKQKKDEERKKQAEEERKAYEDEVQKAKEFIESLTDLEVFKQSGWTIKERIG